MRPPFAPVAASILAASLGAGIWARHGTWFACVGGGSVGAVARSSTGSGFLPVVLAALAVLVLLQALTARMPRQRDRRDCERLLATARLGLALPLATLLLDPLSFRCTAPALGALGVAGVLVHASLLARRRAADRERVGEPRSRWTAPAVAVLAMALPLAVLSGWPGASGDEPHYLLLSQSMWKDGDLDIAREYEERDHRAYWLSPLSPHARPGIEPGSRYSIHGIGTAVALLPAFAAAELLGPASITWLARLLQVLAYGVFGLVLYRAARAIGGDGAGWPAAALALPLLPLVVYPLAIFPEPWAMLAACLSFLLLRSPGRLSVAVAGGVALATLPWLGVKLLPLTAALALTASLRRQGPLSPRARLAAVWGPLALSLLGHALYTWTLYGSLSPMAIYLGAPGESIGRDPALGSDWRAYVAAWPGAVRTLFGHLLDQKDGLLAVAPHYLLAALAAPWMWRRRRPDLLALAFVWGAHALPYALSQELGGQSPPVRPLTPVVWVLAILVGVGLSRPLRRWAATLAGVLIAASAWITLRLLSAPELLSHDYPVQVSRLLLSLSSDELPVWRWFPLWVNYGEAQWGVTLAWTAAAALLAVALAARGTGEAREAAPPPEAARTRPGAAVNGHVAAAGTFAALTGVALVLGGLVAVPLGHEGGEVMAPGVRAWVPGGYPSVGWVEAGNVWVRPGPPREVVYVSERPVGELRVALRSLVPTDVFLAFGDTRVQTTLSPDSRATLTVAGLEGRRTPRGWAYRAILGASAGAAPAQVQGGTDYRVLGANLRILEVEAAERNGGAGPDG